MVTIDLTVHDIQVIAALGHDDVQVRLKAALAAGTHPTPVLLDHLIERCAVEPDGNVRDTLSWALLRQPAELTLPRLRAELDSERNQARSQALHTLSKIGDERAWPWITLDMLRDPDDDVAKTACRAAAALVPAGHESALVEELVRRLGRGSDDLRLAVSRALVHLGEVSAPALRRAVEHPDTEVAVHARATELLLAKPGIHFDTAIHEAKGDIYLARLARPTDD
ncbi:MAG: HEAT repeat domain-containing protein [Mobilicoccus sp.]|nr:HEAT repeat domain-containing protein [Mobilicoccus sp.]